MTRPEIEARELSRLASEELAALPRGIGDIHAAIAGRVFGLLGAPAAPVRFMHDTISRGVYVGVSGGLRVGSGAAGAFARSRVRDVPLSETARGAMVIAALNGLYGDRLELEASPLAIPMQVRRVGAPATARVAVFVHGLGETEYAWGGADGYGPRLARDHGFTPVYVRFNSGRHISENGASLAGLLDKLVAEWPVEVEQLVLVGHSMGGLVARSAGHRGGAWTDRVTHVVSLGTPHGGAPLEKAVHGMCAALALAPETRPFARFLRRRSAGIRDLRRGSLVDEDWRDRDPDALRAKALREVPLLAGAVHCFVAASITQDTRHPVSRALGDMLVLVPSALGHPRTRLETFTVGSTHHLALLNHPEVYARLSEWVAVH